MDNPRGRSPVDKNAGVALYKQTPDITCPGHVVAHHKNNGRGTDCSVDPIRSQEAPPKPKMSKEEAEQKALELQAKLKREREAREKQEAKDREKARIESTKMMLETNAQLEEEERKRAIEQRKREQR